jgi:hypothetical protein
MNYRPLPQKFTRKGFTHELLDRIGLVAIYERWKEGQQSRWSEDGKLQLFSM